MNFIAATVELRSIIPDQVNAYGLEYRAADAVIPSGSSNGEVKLRALCYNRSGSKLDAFLIGKQAAAHSLLVTSFSLTTLPSLLTCWLQPLSSTFLRICIATRLFLAMHSSDLTKLRNVRTDNSQSKLEPHLIMQTPLLGSSWNSTKAENLNLMIDSAKVGAFASMATCVNIAKKGTRALTVRLSLTTSYSQRARTNSTAQRKRTTSTRSRTTRAGSLARQATLCRYCSCWCSSCSFYEWIDQHHLTERQMSIRSTGLLAKKPQKIKRG